MSEKWNIIEQKWQIRGGPPAPPPPSKLGKVLLRVPPKSTMAPQTGPVGAAICTLHMFTFTLLSFHSRLRYLITILHNVVCFQITKTLRHIIRVTLLSKSFPQINEFYYGHPVKNTVFYIKKVLGLSYLLSTTLFDLTFVTQWNEPINWPKKLRN